MENTGTCLCGVTKYLLKGNPEMTAHVIVMIVKNKQVLLFQLLLVF